jgi:subtilisin family serine protease
MPVIDPILPTDTYFHKQWYLLNTGQSGGLAGIDLNVTGVWADYTGRGVTVAVYDDGVEYTHPDLDDNYNFKLLHGKKFDAAHYETYHQHGTHVSGVIAAERNGIGTVGVAYDAQITGINMSSPGIPEGLLSFPPDFYSALPKFDITNHSYVTDGRSALFSEQFSLAADTGRDGLGTLHFASAGNFKFGTFGNERFQYLADENVWADIDSVTVVAAVGHHGFITDFSSPGHSVLISGLGNQTVDSGIWTPDPIGSAGWSDGTYELPQNSDPDYTADFGGTSAAAPMVAAVAALMLEANPDLGWRDVQSILALSARHMGSAVGTAPELDELHSWAFNGADNWNGGGLHYSPDYGFGLVDALAAVRLAETWEDQQTSENLVLAPDAGVWSGSLAIPGATADGPGDWVHFTIDVTAALNIETLRINVVGVENTALRLLLTSPGGAQFQITNGLGSFYTTDAGTKINAFRGEDAQGQWTVSVQDRLAGDLSETLTQVSLSFTGSQTDDDDTYFFTNEFSNYVGTHGHIRNIGNGVGIDTLNAAAVTAATTLDLSNRTGMIDGEAVSLSSSLTRFLLGDGADRVEGGSGATFVRAGRGNDDLTARGGNDTLMGEAGDDRLRGGNGSDLLYDGTGSDWLSGGGGRDTFVMSMETARDTIAGFEDGLDLIDLSAFAGARFRNLVLRDVASGQVELTVRGDAILITSLISGFDSADLTRQDFLFA